MPDQAPPKSRRRRLRLSVRGLIVLVLIICAGLGWVVRSARIQREAVAAIEHSGGGASYSWEWSDGKGSWGGRPWAPQWLVDLIGVDYFGHVTGGSLAETETDSAVVEVERLRASRR